MSTMMDENPFADDERPEVGAYVLIEFTHIEGLPDQVRGFVTDISDSHIQIDFTDKYAINGCKSIRLLSPPPDTLFE